MVITQKLVDKSLVLAGRLKTAAQEMRAVKKVEQIAALPESMQQIERLSTACEKNAQQMVEVTQPVSYANDIIQYEKLKNALRLRIEEFSSILDVTEHGIMRLLERGIKAEDLLQALTSPDFLKIQNDGLKVYIKLVQNDKYNVFIVNPSTKKLVTAMPGLSKKSLHNLGKNYGWNI